MPGDFDVVKERIDIVQLVGEKVPLKRAGRVYKGLCPFHAEKTPSFYVDPERRTFKCFGCLPPGSLIKTATGPRPIEIIDVGDHVYAGDGRLHKVLQVHEHAFSGDLVKLICAPFKIPLLLTPDHKVPVLRPKSKRLEQVPAGEIRPQNYLLYPPIERPAANLDWTALPGWYGTRGKLPKALPKQVHVDRFAEWLGWYLAEGSVSNDRSVRFSLSGDEGAVAERLGVLTAELFGERLRRADRPARDSIDLWFCHALLGRWLKHHCGDGARNKRLPDFVWTWAPKPQWALIDALVLGDARISRGGPVSAYKFVARPSWRLSLGSVRLIDDVRDLLIANGMVPGLTERTEVDGRMSWQVTVVDDVPHALAERPPYEPVRVRVRQVARVPYDGPVYNLTVDQEHTYLTLSGTVCNCGEGGDVFTWLEKQDGLDAGEALRVLAERAGVELTRRAPEVREHEKRLLAAHDTAHFYFRQALRGTDAGRAAAQYLEGRGIQAATVEKFGLGYAPNLRDGLLLYLRKKGFSDDEAIAAGLIITHEERGLLDRFRDRLIVPLRDGKGRIIGFAGRAMRPDQPAKYINSPRTELFDKGATLFALDVAKSQIRRKSEAVIVEGQFDAISCHQAGLDNAVASMGTALTEGQYRLLNDLKIEKAVVAFDGDAAGEASAEKRGRELALIVQRATRVAQARRGTVSGRVSTNVHVAVLPAGMDPDQLARSDPDALRTILAGAVPVLEFVIEQVRRRSDLTAPDGRRRFLSETVPLLAEESDQMTRELYAGTLSRLTGVAEETLRAELAGARRTGMERPAGAFPVVEAPASAGNGQRPPSAQRDLERYVVAQLLQFPEEAARSELDPDDFTDPDHRAIFELLRAGERPGPRYPAPLAAVAAALGASAPQPLDEDQAVRAIEQGSQRLRDRNLRRRIEEKRAARARGDGDIGGLDAEIDRLTDELTRLMHEREQGTAPGPAPEDEDE